MALASSCLTPVHTVCKTQKGLVVSAAFGVVSFRTYTCSKLNSGGGTALDGGQKHASIHSTQALHHIYAHAFNTQGPTAASP